MKRAMPVLLAMLLAGGPAFSWAGPLDLDLYAAPVLPSSGTARSVSLPLDLYQPGSRLNLRGEGVFMTAFSHAGYTTLGALGLAESLPGAAKGDSDAIAASVGFGLVTLIQAWTGWRFFRDRDKKSYGPDRSRSDRSQ